MSITGLPLTIRPARVKRSLSLTLLFVLTHWLLSSFTAMAKNDGSTTKSKSDSTATEKDGFKSLFKGGFDPAKPYAVQLNPQAVSFVQEYVRKQGKEMEQMKIWGKPYFDMYDGILAQYNLPKEMKYLSVIESHLKSGLVSWAGAVGPWQIMPYEAKRLGLKVTRYNDERTDHYKSTHAAARLMNELYKEFNDWLLVVAAYNAGAGRVKQAIRKSGSRDFWKLQYSLPLETRNHVKKFIATHYIFEGAGGWVTMTKAETEVHQTNLLTKPTIKEETDISNTTTVDIKGKYNSVVIANHLAMDMAQFNKYNPDFDQQIATGIIYKLRLPNDKIALFESKKLAILGESVQLLLKNATVASPR
jgi:membrane-bound lytic murein transglycosylase D